MRVAWLFVCFAVVLGPAAVVVGWPLEAWPWTCAPMFAAPIDDLALYEPTVTVVDERGSERPLRTKALGIPERHFVRLLLVDAYGSIDPTEPFGFVADDTPAQFQQRLDAYFDGVKARLEKAGKGDRLPARGRLRLDVRRVSDGIVHTVGTYDVATATFTKAKP